MKIICISGKAQHGKDTTAGFLYDKLTADGNRVLIMHYADLLKFICKQYFKWDGNKDEHGRTLLQYVGTDIVRKKQPDFWVDFVSDFAHIFYGTWDYLIIPDCRFPNEILNLKESGHSVVHLRVVRKGFKSPLTEEQQRHPSETALDLMPYDLLVDNEGTLKDLKRFVENNIELICAFVPSSYQNTFTEVVYEGDPS